MSENTKNKKGGFSLHKLAHKFKLIALVGGFIFDLYILPPINTGKFWWVGPTYIGVIFVCLVMRQVFRGFINNGTLYFLWRFHNMFFNLFSFFASFFLGSLLAYSLIYYSTLSDIFSVWPIFLIILFAIILNESLKDKIFDVALFMLAVNFYFILNTPIFFKEVSNSSLYLALTLAFLFNALMTKIIKAVYHEHAHSLIYTVFLFLIPSMIYGLYYFKYLPAVPLKLGESGFYSYIEKVDNGIQMEYYKEEKGKTVASKYFDYVKEVRVKKESLDEAGELYFFSSVIAPINADIKSIISHSWEKWNEKDRRWEKKFSFSFPVFGDRAEGYRGYSIKSKIEKGEWRVRVLSDDRIVGTRKVIVE